MNLSNGTLSQTGLASLDVNSLGQRRDRLDRRQAGGLRLPRSPTRQRLSTGTLGTQIETFSLNVGDDHTLPGASAPTNISTSATLTVLGHAAPSLSIVSRQQSNGHRRSHRHQCRLEPVQRHAEPKRTCLVGCQFAWARRDRLDGRQVGGLRLLAILHGNPEHRHAWARKSQTFSLNVGDDHTLSGASAPTNLSTTATLTVLDHSNASLSSTANANNPNDQLRQRAAGGDHPQPELHDLQPGGEHVGSLHGESETDRLHGQRRCGIDHEPFDLQRACGGQRQVTYTASLNTSNYTTTGINDHHHVRFPTGRRQHVARCREQQ